MKAIVQVMSNEIKSMHNQTNSTHNHSSSKVHASGGGLPVKISNIIHKSLYSMSATYLQCL